MKKAKVIDFSIGIPLFLISFFIFVLFSYVIVSKVSLFFQVNQLAYWISFSISFLLSLIISISFSVNFRREHIFVWFIRNHLTGLITSVLLLLLFIVSIHKDLLLDKNTAISLLGIEWAIFAISIGSFAVWHAIVFKTVYQPHDNDLDYDEGEVSVENEIRKITYLTNKSYDNFYYTNNGESIIYIAINLIVICLATGACFLFSGYSIEVETIIIFALYCCTNTLVNIMLGIISDVFKRRKEMIKSTKVKPSEINDSFDNIKVISFISAIDFINTKLPPDSLTFDDPTLDDYFCKCRDVLDEYHKDKNSVIDNRKEILKLMSQLFKYAKRAGKKALKKQKLLKKELNKLQRIIKKY